ncbi:MAG: response regulator [Pseudodesulfovibrio sp.]|nr:response regulator [Pseudodesulfovibrio sp.]
MRFLIVDDDESIHLYLQAVLAPFAQCDSAMSGELGVDLFNEAHAEGLLYDVVMMDILMPGMDGHQTAEILRAKEKEFGINEYHQFKLVMITSLVDDVNVSKAFFKTHASCYIVKPLDKEKIIDELRQNLII